MAGNKLENMGLDTIAIHSGFEHDPVTGATSLPIYQSSSYVFNDAEHAADLFSLKKAGFVYSRLTNPTVDALEKRLAALEGGTGATCTASGLASSLLALYTVMNAGDEFIASRKIYGGTGGQFRDSFKRAFGWTCHFVDPLDLDAYKAQINEKTRAIFVESLSNPEGVVVDIEAVAKLADEAGIPLIVDNTVASPAICRPFDYGASVVTHSTTKYLSGHGHSMGGVVIDGGTFDWMKYEDKFPAMTQETHGYRGMIFARDVKDCPFAMHNHAVGLRDLGINQQPMNAYLTFLGIETLTLRMEKHSNNSLKVAEFLQGHENVEWVNHPGLKDNPSHANAQKYLKNGWCSSLFTFGVKGGHDAAAAVVSNAKIFKHLANIGDTRSLIIHPSSTTHAQLTDEEKLAAGVYPETIRLSVGIEDADDLIADLSQALGSAQAMAA